MLLKKAEIISELQRDILRLQGFKPSSNNAADVGLGSLKHAFPNATFPLGSIHEFLSPGTEAQAATSGFISGLLSPLMQRGGTALWISSSRNLFPPALKGFGIQPDRIIFIDVKKEREVMWALDEALKCAALTAVVGEIKEISFTASRRLQLAVEQSQVTGFIICNPRNLNATACVARWRISPLPGESLDDLPGLTFPQWKVELLRVKNGRPGIWEMKWADGRFHGVHKIADTVPEYHHQQTG